MEDEDYISARIELDSAIDYDQSNNRYYLLRGICQYRLKEYKQAAEDFWQAKILGAPSAMCHSYCGLCRKATGEFSAAENDFRSAIESGANDADVYYNRGVCRLEQNDFSGAVADFESSIERDAKVGFRLFVLGLARVLANRPRQALQALDEAEALGWRRTALYIRRADAYLALGEDRAAESDLNVAIDMDPDIAIAHRMLGWLYRRRGDQRQAIRAFSEEIRLRPRRIDGYLDRGICHMNLKDLPAALADFDKAHDLAPKSPRPMFHRADCLLRMSCAEEALEAVGHSLRLGPGYLPAQMLKAHCLGKLNRWELARKCFEAVIARDDAYPAAHYHLGLALDKLGDRNGAIREISIDIEQNPKQGMPYLIRGELHEHLGRFDLAAADFEKAVTLLKTQGREKAQREALAGLKRIRG
jgi:tetratricopeptide (TPR) repeat protein